MTLEPLLRAAINNATPRPQGNMRAMIQPATGRAIVTHQKPDIINHRTHVAAVLAQAWNAQPYDQAVNVDALFAFPRPAGHRWPVNGRHHGELRDDAPSYPTGRSVPDVDKLQRLIGDALQLAGIIADDALIVTWNASKMWTDMPHGWTHVTVWPTAEIDAVAHSTT